MENIFKDTNFTIKILIIKTRVRNKLVYGSENKETSIHGYNDWKNLKVKLRSSSPLRCAKTASFFSSPSCLSLLIRQKDAFISAPLVTASAEQNQNGIRIPGRKFPRGRLKHPTRAPASRRSPAGFHAGACKLSGERVVFCSKSADFHARVPEVDSLHSHGFILIKNNYQSKLYPEMQKHSKTRQKHTNAWLQDTNPSHYRTF